VYGHSRLPPGRGARLVERPARAGGRPGRGAAVAPLTASARLLESGLASQRGERHAEALSAFERCLEMVPADPVAHLHAGRSSLKLGRWERGVAHSRVAVALAPENAAAWSNLALGWRTLDRAAQARVAVQRALALDARLAHAWYVLGRLDHDEGANDAARAHF